MNTYTINTDGGSRGNPGPAAIGIVIQKEQQTIYEIAKTIGTATNNIAEYTAVKYALQYLENNEKENASHLILNFVLDSELVVRQLTGVYKIKDAKLQQLAHDIQTLEHHFHKVNYMHVKRELNKNADALVNKALDEQL